MTTVKHNKMKIVFSFLVLFITVQLSAQTRIISGTVKDGSGEELIGANILVKGQKTGTLTDLNGKFKLPISATATQIVVSYIGYISKTIAIKDKTVLNIILEPNNKSLDEVVVVGYGNMRKSDITGSVSSVKVSDQEANSATSLQSLIEGKAAGVQVTTGDAAPGSAINIKIRGTSSLTGSSEPLYVVDGIIMNSAMQDTQAMNTGGGMVQNAQNGLTGISPQDIESMEILKDASATAIYGSLGANGVILITTKKGKTEVPKIQFVSSLSQAEEANPRKMLNLTEYLQFATLMGTPVNGTGLVEANWQDILTRKALSYNNRLNISGKTDNTNYYISGGYTNNNGVITGTGVKQADFRMNINQTLSENVSIGSNTSFNYQKTSMTTGSDTRSSANSGMIRSMLVFRPYMTSAQAIQLNEDSYSDNTLPTAWLTNFSDASIEYRVLSSLFVNIKINKWLSMRTTGGLDFRSKSRKQWFGTQVYQGMQVGGLAGIASFDALRYNLDHVFNIALKSGPHKFNGNVGVTAIGTNNANNTIVNTRFNGNTALQVDGIMYGTNPSTPNYNEDLTSTFSGLCRLVYSYNDKYVLTSSFRADGTSKFAPGNKFSYFPSFALAYRFDQEKFMKNQQIISNMKFRAGWGMVGNQTISPYQTETLYGSGGNLMANALNNGNITGVSMTGISNPALKWETTRQYNFGVDLGFFKNRINFTIDAYQKQSTDLLQSIDLPLNAGASKIWINRGTIENKGIEFSADIAVIKTKNTSLNIGGNISLNRNKIIDIGLPVSVVGSYNWAATWGSVIGYDPQFKEPANIFIEGYPTGMFFGRKVDGIVSKDDEQTDRNTRIANYLAAHPIDPATQLPTDPALLTNAQLTTVNGTMATYNNGSSKVLLTAGDPKWVDINGDGTVDQTGNLDKTLIGDPNPDFTFGLTLDFKYKNFFISALFSGVSGNQIVNANRMYEERVNSSGVGTPTNITAAAFYGAWSETNQSGTYPKIKHTGYEGIFSSMIVEDGSYLRLSNLTGGYNFKIKGGKPISNLALSISGRNLFCITKYTGFDPEVTSFMNDWSRKGIDYGSYPNSKTIILGVTIDF